MSPLLRSACGAAILLVAACQKQPESTKAAAQPPPAPKKEAVEVVKETERSRNFAAVNRHLELGGTLYGYVDVEGDVLKLMGTAQNVLQEVAKADPNAAMFAQQNLGEIARILGLTDVRALGVSSVPDGSGYYRNRLFLYTAGERNGLMAAVGGKPGPFKHVGLAPADTVFYAESEMDMAVVYKTLKDVVMKVAGEPMGNQMEAALKKAGEAVTLSVLDLIYGLKGRTAVVLRVDAEKTMKLPGRDGMTFPAFALLACVEGVGQILEPSLKESRDLKRREVGTMAVYEFAQAMPIEGLKPAIVIDGSTLFVTTSVEFLQECREQKSGLAQAAEFKDAVAQVGTEGNGLMFVSPRLFTQLNRLESLNTNLPPQARSTLKFVLAQMPASDRPLVSVRTNLDDGILVKSYYNRSLKQELLAASIYNPVTVGLMAAMAIPAFQKVRIASQEKAIVNNLRQLAAAADQFYLENGRRSATYDDLVGPNKYVRVLNPVAGESYRQIKFVQGEPIGVVLRDGRMIQYPPAGMGRPPATRSPQPAPRPKKQE